MERRLLPSLVLAAALVVPSAARADFGVRAAYLVPMFVNTGQSVPGTPSHYGPGDQWLSNLDIIASWYPISFLSLDVEGQFNLTGTDPKYPMTGIYVGPGVTLDLPLFLYARASLPIQVTGGDGSTPGTPIAYLRLGGGLKLELFIVRLYLEVTADFAYAGTGISFFGSQTINVAAGLWVRF